MLYNCKRICFQQCSGSEQSESSSKWCEVAIILDKVLISGVTVCGRIFSPAAEFFWLNWPRSPGWIWQQCTFSIHYTAVSECCWELRRQPPPVTEPWLHTDCWRGFKPLVPSDKRFNHSKVWCTFISSSTTTVYAVQVCDCCCVNECYNIVVVVQSCCSVLLSCIYCIYCIYRYLPIDAIDAIR